MTFQHCQTFTRLSHVFKEISVHGNCSIVIRKTHYKKRPPSKEKGGFFLIWSIQMFQSKIWNYKGLVIFKK